jgi:catechol-2,3-dioxygenase
MGSTAGKTFETGHVGLNVSDLSRSKVFYQDLFGFGVIHESVQPDRRWVFLGEPDRVVLTLWQQADGRFAKKQSGLHHLSFAVKSLDEVREFEKKLQARKVTFQYEGAVPHSDGAESGGLFFEDPDGIRLEVYAPSGLAGEAAPVPGAPTCGFF